MKIFLSSTFRDLQSEREIIIKSLNKAGISSSGMELFVAEAEKPKDVCLRELNNSDLVLLIAGSKYGSIDPETNLSFTHLEFREACKSNKPILAFLYKGTGFLESGLIRKVKQYLFQDYKANTKFHNEIKEQITVDFFSNQNELLGIIWPSLHNYLVKNGTLCRPVKTFQTFTEFYCFYQTQQYLFNYTQKLIGRESELKTLNHFIKDETKYIAVVSGIGGIGKSKLIYDFSSSYMAENDDFEFRYLSSQIEYIDLETVRELPAKNVCLVVEDAHRRTDLDKILYTFLSLSNSPYKIKLIFSTRPSGLDKLKSALANYPNEIVSHLPLDYLTKENAKLLAESVLEKQGDIIEQLIAISNRNTLVLIIAAQLLKENKISGSLIQEADFVDKVLEKLLDEVKQIGQIEGVDLSQLLTIFSGISPFNPNSKDTQNTLSNIFAKAEWFKLSKAIEKLMNLGYLLKRGNTLRVVPDVLSDYIFFSKAIDSTGQSTKFVDYLFEVFSKEYFGNILQNTAEIEYSLIKNLEGRTLLNNVWDEIFEKIKKATDHSELVGILKELKRVAFFSPYRVFEITKWVIDNSKLLQDNPENTDTINNSQWIIENITPVLKTISYHDNYTKDVCNILWGLANNKFRNIRTNSHPSHPFRVLSEMASLDDRNYYSIVHNTIDAIKDIITRQEHLNCYYDIQEIVESILKPEIENHESTIRGITISWFCVFNASKSDLPRIKEIRDKTFELLHILLNDDNAKSLLKTAQVLIYKTQEPNVRGQLSDSAKAEFVKEGEKALILLQTLLNTHKYDTLNYFIYTQLISKESHLLDELKERVQEIASSYKPTFKDEIMYLIQHDWAEYDPDEEHDKTEKAFYEKQKAYAENLWQKCDNDPSKAIEYIESIINDLEEYGLKCTGYFFQQECAKARPQLINDAIDVILLLKKPDSAISIFNWIPYLESSKKADTAKKILSKGEVFHKISLASAISSFADVPQNDLTEILKSILKENDGRISRAIIRSIGYLYNKSGNPKQLIDILCQIEIDDGKELDAILSNFSRKSESRQIPWEHLKPEHIQSILKKIENIDKLTDEYSIGLFLSHLADKNPLSITQMLLRRIDKNVEIRKRESSDKIQPFPYLGFHNAPQNLSNNLKFKECVSEIIKAMRNEDWDYMFWCPKVFKWLDNAFSSNTQDILLELISNKSNEQEKDIISITYIFEEYERNLFFKLPDFVNRLLLKASDIGGECFERVKSKLSFMPFSGTRCISGLGKHDDLCISIIEHSEKILADINLQIVLKSFYEDLIKFAKSEDEDKLKRDKNEIEEWGDE